MSALLAEPLTEEAFAPFGAVLRAPVAAGQRDYFDEGLANLRAEAKPSLSIVRGTAAEDPPQISIIERHAFSSQSFLPLAPARWIVVVAPGGDGGPDLARVRAFLPGPNDGVTFAPGTWHAPLTTLDAAAFAIVMWRNGGPLDEEILPVPPFAVHLPQGQDRSEP